MRREWNLLVRAPARPWIGRLLPIRIEQILVEVKEAIKDRRRDSSRAVRVPVGTLTLDFLDGSSTKFTVFSTWTHVNALEDNKTYVMDLGFLRDELRRQSKQFARFLDEVDGGP
jgi:hypothetical protein